MIKHSNPCHRMQEGPDSSDICIYTLYYFTVFQRTACTIKTTHRGFNESHFHLEYKKMTFMTGSFEFRGWVLWGTTKGGKKSPIPPPGPSIPPFPIGADTPELALTCGRQGAPSGSERRAYAMPATSSAQPCMKYEIKKTHNFIPSYVRSHIHIVSCHHQLVP